MFDSIITEASQRFGTGDSTRSVLSALLKLIGSPERGGLRSFIDKLRQAGWGPAVDSWIGQGESNPISGFQLESALGTRTVDSIAREAGVSQDTALTLLSFMIPRVIDMLTPDGKLPDDSTLSAKLSEGIGAFGTFGSNLGSSAANLGRGAASTLGRGAASTVDSVAGGVGSAVGTVSSSAENVLKRDGRNSGSGGWGGTLKWVLPLLLFACLMGIGYSCLTPNANTPIIANTNGSVPASGQTSNSQNAAGKVVESSVRVEAKNGKYAVSGVVPDQASFDKVKTSLVSQFGEESCDLSGLRIDPNARPFGPGWPDGFVKLLPSLKDWKNGAIAFSGNTVTTADGLPQPALAQLTSIFTGWTLPVSIAGADAATEHANEEALGRLETATSIDQVISAMNASIINFRSGSAEIPSEAKLILEKAAAVLKKQPDQTVVEIGGYTDNQGNPEANKKLSQNRAEAVKNALVAFGVNSALLRPVGYGNANPIGDNNTEEGRFKNRRIEYRNANGTVPTASTAATGTR